MTKYFGKSNQYWLGANVSQLWTFHFNLEQMDNCARSILKFRSILVWKRVLSKFAKIIDQKQKQINIDKNCEFEWKW